MKALDFGRHRRVLTFSEHSESSSHSDLPSGCIKCVKGCARPPCRVASARSHAAVQIVTWMSPGESAGGQVPRALDPTEIPEGARFPTRNVWPGVYAVARPTWCRVTRRDTIPRAAPLCANADCQIMCNDLATISPTALTWRLSARHVSRSGSQSRHRTLSRARTSGRQRPRR